MCRYVMKENGTEVQIAIISYYRYYFSCIFAIIIVIPLLPLLTLCSSSSSYLVATYVYTNNT